MQKIRCAYCGEKRGRTLVHKCGHCGKMYCISHHLPERHECQSVSLINKRYLIGPATHGGKRPKDVIFSTSETGKRGNERKESAKASKGFFNWLRKNLGNR